MTYRCAKCTSEKVLITGRAKQVDIHPIEGPHYEVRCHDCGAVNPPLIANRHDRWHSPMFDAMIYGGRVGGGKTAAAFAEIEKSFTNKESAMNYTLLHERINLDHTEIRALKKACPKVFPEYTDLQAAKDGLKRAQQHLDEKAAVWKALGAAPKKVKAQKERRVEDRRA